MKRNFLTRFLVFFLALALIVPISAGTNAVTAYAASAALSAKSKTIIMGSSYTFTVKNAVNVKLKSWSSSKSSVAKIAGNGKVTPVAPGKTTIKCKIAYTNGTSETLSATVTVKARIPATKVTLSKEYTGLNAIQLKVGETYQLKFAKEPTNTTDYAYFFVAEEEYASVTTSGKITAKKPGITMLEARAGLNKTDAKRLANTATDRVYLYIEPAEAQATPTPLPETVKPEVTGVTLVSSKELKIDFSAELLESSVIDPSGNLRDNTVTIGQVQDAKAFNLLTPSLSKDKKSLLLAASGSFEGTYVVTVSDGITSLSGAAITPYTKQLALKDTTGPSYVETTIDDTGYISHITFSEAIDITSMTIYSIVGTDAAAVKAYLTNTSNYILSNDKKTLSIDLSPVGVNKMNVLVYFTGIKDVLGNATNPFTISARVEMDTTPKPNAIISDIKRSSKNLMTVTFNKAVQLPGYAYIGNIYVNGMVDAKDNKKVNYAIPNPALTGTQVVRVSGWMSYNSTAIQNIEETKGVDFSLDNTAPALIGYTLTGSIENKIPVLTLTLTYNKDVTIINGSGKMETKITSENYNVYNKSLEYTAVAKGKVVTVTFANQMSELGKYSFSIPAIFVMDSYENSSVATTITVEKQMDASSSLPAPISIEQSIESPDILRVKFGQKLDVTTATTVTNYRIGIASYPISASIAEQNETSAVVELHFPNNAIPTTGSYPITVRGIKGFNNTYAEMKEYNVVLPLVENTAPIYQGAKLTSPYTIVLTFSEAITGSIDAVVYDGNVVVGSSVTISGKELYLALTQPITTVASISLTNNQLKDVSGNAAMISLNTRLPVAR